MSHVQCQPGAIALPPALDLSGAGELKSMLLADIATGEPSILDGSHVQRVATPGVQILLAYANTTAQQGQRPKILNPSEALKAAFDELGLGHQLSQWSIA